MKLELPRVCTRYEGSSYNKTRCTRGDASSFFSVLTIRICMHKTKFLMNIFKYCFKNYIKLHEFANCNSATYDI